MPSAENPSRPPTSTVTCEPTGRVDTRANIPPTLKLPVPFDTRLSLSPLRTATVQSSSVRGCKRIVGPSMTRSPLRRLCPVQDTERGSSIVYRSCSEYQLLVQYAEQKEEAVLLLRFQKIISTVLTRANLTKRNSRGTRPKAEFGCYVEDGLWKNKKGRTL